MKREYQLLKWHMDCNPTYLFGHAKISGLLASSDNTLNTYAKYKLACNKEGVNVWNEDIYNQFMIDCDRVIEQPQALGIA